MDVSRALANRFVAALVIGSWLIVSACGAAERPAGEQKAEPSRSTVPDGKRPPANAGYWKDDASLHGLCFVGTRDGWAVGDHGAIWRTHDSGRTWELLPCPVDSTLRSVCFLTDRVGFVVGGATTPFTRVGVGVILMTRDGGKTWKELGKRMPPLPQLHFIRLFPNSEGIIVGDASTDFPAGILATKDGGKTWQAVEGTRHEAWRAAAFSTPTTGVAIGLDGTAARIDGGRVIDVRAGRFGLRGLYDVQLDGDDGWMVGDGAIILQTHNRGVAWDSPTARLPDEALDLFNFHAVAVRGRKLWVGGAPGSVVWHSPDGGRSWRPQPTGQTVPIERIAFSTDETGCAIGAFGSILHTQDGGATWEVARGGPRRAALLEISSRPDRVSFSMLAKESAELGYRSVVVLPVRGQGEGEGARDPQTDLKLHDAVTAAGGSQTAIGWRFPLDIPGLDRDPQKLIADWMRRTEGRFQPAFYGSLVCQIRTWRPTVVVIDQAAPDDSAATVLASAVLSAVRQAGDPTAFPEHQQLASLGPWTTSRVFARLPAGSTGDCVLQAHEFLPRSATTVSNLSMAASSRLTPLESDVPETEAFRLVDVSPQETAAGGNLSGIRDFFAGLSIAPGTDARRQLRNIDGGNTEQAQWLARRDRNFRAMIRSQIHSSSRGAELIGMLQTATRGSDRATAALQRALLADAYTKNFQWELAEATLLDLVERYPDEPATAQAMQWLFQYWTSAELIYQRLRQESVETRSQQFNAQAFSTTIERALALARTDPKDRDPTATQLGPDPLRFVTKQNGLRVVGARGDFNSMRWAQQHDVALKMAALIRKKSPALYRTPAIQFPLAAVLRESGLTGLPTEVENKSGRRVVRTVGAQAVERATDLSVTQASGVQSDGASAASDSNATDPNAAESIAAALGAERTVQKTIKCRIAPEGIKPDGLLSDTCWQAATEIPLGSGSAPLAGDAPQTFVLLAHDEHYLYFAASVPRVAGVPKDGPMGLGRQHDQEMSAYDRLSFFIDVDRDGVTWYEIDIDQRGCVAESCCSDPSWNPKLFVAADADDQRWRIEGAIPFSELVPRAPRAGDGWGLAIVRTAPAVKQEAWIPPASTKPKPESFGLLRFQ